MRTPLQHHKPIHCGRFVRRLSMVLTAILGILGDAALLAQDEGGAGTTVVTPSRGWIVEAFIVGIVFALALFVICRSSRRN
jgi:hypothetical protein